MSRDKQIEEITRHCPVLKEGKCFLFEDGSVKCNMNCDMHDFAIALYNAGYRKQSEGENIALYPTSAFECSICNWSNWDLATGDGLYNYCPNCGAKMKGGAE